MEKMLKLPKVKICGITSRKEAEYLNEAEADYAGFVFYEKSRRNISLKEAGRIKENLAAGILKVAVTVSPAMELAGEIEKMGFDVLQVHGELSREVREHTHLPIWRAVNITDADDLEQFFKQESDLGMEKIKGYVADGAGYGSGRTFDWEGLSKRVRQLTGKKELILAGGLTTENVRVGIRYFMPEVVDVSSGVEENGKKSREKIRDFIRKVRENEQ